MDKIQLMFLMHIILDLHLRCSCSLPPDRKWGILFTEIHHLHRNAHEESIEKLFMDNISRLE